ncbi:MAG: TetR/AcrR family transcriptional regulator [Thermoplasmatota archaeon]
MRTVKEHDVRKKEIADTAGRLFIEHGYEETPVEMIIREVGIAKGTFYHYFSSKEALLDLLVDDLIEEVKTNIKAITGGKGDALTKIFRLSTYFRTLAIGKERMTDYLHEDKNAHIHLKIEKRVTPPLVECYTNIIEQGIEEGLFNVNYPRETALAMLGAAQGLSEGHHDHADRDKIDPRNYEAVLDIYGRILGTPEGLLEKRAEMSKEGEKDE